ncbi:MAG: type I glyceraldehyde-3-phosphate dehydrogenase [Nanoarchaeota archaeon]
MSANVGINGFGRVGRTFFRVNYEEQDPSKKQNITIIKDIQPLENLAYLLKHDSTYGTFMGEVSVKGNALIVDEKEIQYFKERDVTNVPWGDLGINVLVEASGAMTIDDARPLIKSPLTNVVYDRKQNGVDHTFVMGVNHQDYDSSEHKIISASTCTGNAIVPVAKIINSAWGIKRGYIMTIHPVLTDQSLLDVAYEKCNLGRSALRSIIPTSTGVVESLETILPELRGKITGGSYRVPVDIVSAITATFDLKRPATPEEVNSLFRQKASGKMKGVIEYDPGFLGNQKVSIDFFKNPHAVIFSSLETKVSQGNLLTVSLFHDNEWGYCCRVHKLIDYIHRRNTNNG